MGASDSQPLPDDHDDAVLRNPVVQALRFRRWRRRQGSRCAANLGAPAQVGGNQWIRQDLDQVVPSDGMDETAIDPQRYPGSRGVRAERELVAEKDDDPTAGGGAIALHRDTIGRGRNGIERG